MLLLLALILPLSLDTFAVSAALGVAGVGRHRRFKLGLLFAFFEGGMPLVGLFVGAGVGEVTGNVGSYIASFALVALGAYLLLANEDAEERRVAQFANAGALALLTSGLAVSLDELAIGFILGLLNVPILPALVAIAIQAFVISQLGFELGGRVQERFREGAQRLAGIVLIGLGSFLIMSKLFSISP